MAEPHPKLPADRSILEATLFDLGNDGIIFRWGKESIMLPKQNVPVLRRLLPTDLVGLLRRDTQVWVLCEDRVVQKWFRTQEAALAFVARIVCNYDLQAYPEFYYAHG